MESGLFEINYSGIEEGVRLIYSAENACGTAGKGVNLKFVDTDVYTLIPPINLTASMFNQEGMGPSFMLTAEFLPYMGGTITKVEYFKDDVLYKTMQNNYLGNILGLSGNLMQNMEYEGNYNFKIRVGNSLGQYSDFSETINVTIPIN